MIQTNEYLVISFSGIRHIRRLYDERFCVYDSPSHGSGPLKRLFAHFPRHSGQQEVYPLRE